MQGGAKVEEGEAEEEEDMIIYYHFCVFYCCFVMYLILDFGFLSAFRDSVFDRSRTFLFLEIFFKFLEGYASILISIHLPKNKLKLFIC